MKHIIKLLCIIALAFTVNYVYAENNNVSLMPLQTDIENAKVNTNDDGIPVLEVEKLGKVYTPSAVALYALAYGGYEDYYNRSIPKDENKFNSSIQWLMNNLKTNKEGVYVWPYEFNHTYNDVTVLSPWYSAFGQAVGIEALLAAYDKTKDKKYLDKAELAAKALLTPINKGGLLFSSNEDIWFEEITVPLDNPSHILNGHMRSLISLKKLADATNNNNYKTYYDKGVRTLINWLPLYDTGYWFRYDLNPRKNELLFRFNNPYGSKLTSLPINKISLRDPLTNKESVLKLGVEGDAEGPLRIAGNDWSQPEVIDERSVRKLLPVMPATHQEQLDGNPHHAPGTYFYLALPSDWSNNLRSDWLELIITYKDVTPGNITLQSRSIAPGAPFQWVKDGDLLLKGSGKWVDWRVPLRPADLGYSVGTLYGAKHTDYLAILSQWEPKLKVWHDLAKGYYNIADNNHTTKKVQLDRQVLPKQTELLPIIAIDDKGVVQQFQPADATQYTDKGIWDYKSDIGKPVYQIFLIALQAQQGAKSAIHPISVHELIAQNKYVKDKKINFVTQKNAEESLSRKPAYQYLLDNAYTTKDNALIWYSEFNNAYNDVAVKPHWSSSFIQAYVIQALKAAVDDKITDPKANYKDVLNRGLKGYTVTVEDGGFLYYSPQGWPFFQEISTAPHHIINAQLVSVTSVKQALSMAPELKGLHEKSLQTIKNAFYLYDTGYWLRYDLNPKKELLMQIDWISGEKSPLIQSVSLENPQTLEETFIDVGADNAFTSYPYISGAEWTVSQEVDGKKARPFLNGYSIRNKPVEKGAQHNVYLYMALPNRTFENDFIIPDFKFKIKYKDVAPGVFQVKLKPIHTNDHHTFFPIRDGILKTTGDQKWKEVTFLLKPQELGWFVGPDYQKFHAEQLKLLGEQTNDWFFKQQAEKEWYYFEAQQNNKPIIIANKG